MILIVIGDVIYSEIIIVAPFDQLTTLNFRGGAAPLPPRFSTTVRVQYIPLLNKE